MWGPAGDGVPSDVITSAVVRAWSVMPSQGYSADVYELPGCRSAHQCLYIIIGKSPLHPLARFRTLQVPLVRELPSLIYSHSSDVRDLPRALRHALRCPIR